MSGERICVNPVATEGRTEELPLNLFVDFERAPYINQVRPYQVEVELTSKCAGSCRYCYASSTTATEIFLPTERVLRLINESAELGVQKMCWMGGDPQLHRDWYDIVRYAADKGLKNFFITSGLLSREDIRKLCRLGDAIEAVTIHIDTIDPEDYAVLHANPKTREQKMQGYRSLLEAGYPSAKVGNCITVTQANARSIPQTIDWFVDEMGSPCILLIAFKGEGFGGAHHDWEPTVEQFRQVAEHRARKLGDFWLRMGSMDAVMYYCRSTFTIQYDGSVSPCPCVRDLRKGNILQEGLREIYQRNADDLLYNAPIKGPCGTCDNRDVCFGCRATAYHYTGDVYASDPKCFLNPEAKDRMLPCRM
ncbi:MAG: radical SAM protein [Candidatus Tectomicrobia bacterium]|uniref:Radical SAM protein n=1 Tax=Tectimicrobiota bacterium TaxID=2528274 RepID=A0A932CR69_UNCTE|nr:radical SAM protein [Candidatus Tectomicrobia bacterium]